MMQDTYNEAYASALKEVYERFDTRIGLHRRAIDRRVAALNDQKDWDGETTARVAREISDHAVRIEELVKLKAQLREDLA